MKKCFIPVLVLVFAAMFFSGCGTAKYTKTDLSLFDTVTVITGFERSKARFDETADYIIDSLREYHQLFDIYHEYDGLTNICTINRNAGGNALAVDERIIELLQSAKNVYDVTNGAVNVAMGSVLSLWHEARTNTMVPPAEDALLNASLHTDYNCVVISGNTVRLTDPDMSIDVGAIAKGFAVEAICRKLEADGISGYLLNVGGNVRTIGKRADGTDWRIAVSDPTGTQTDLVLNISGLSAVTSGTDQRYFEYNGEVYHHIIDPETLYPSTRYASVTIVSPDSGLADGLSTGLFNMNLEDGLALIDSLEGTDALWRFPDGSSVMTDGFKEFT